MKKSHLSGEHGDVVEVSLTSLFHRQSEEEAAPVLREQRLLSLQGRTQTSELTRCMHEGLLLSISLRHATYIVLRTVECNWG